MADVIRLQFLRKHYLASLRLFPSQTGNYTAVGILDQFNIQSNAQARSPKRRGQAGVRRDYCLTL